MDWGAVIKQLLLLFLCAVILSEVEGKGRGGGGRGGGGRGRGGSRSGRGSSGSGSRISGRRYGGYAFAAAASAGYIYGWGRYKTRRRYSSHSSEEPTVCTNYYDYKLDNGTKVHYFICPKYDQSDKYHYCCGPDKQQYCCQFWDKPGHVAGVVIGILVFVLFVSLMIWCFCCKNRKRKPKSTAMQMTGVKDPASDPLNPMHPSQNPPTVMPGAAPYAPPSPVPGHTAYPPQYPAPTGPQAPMYPPQPNAGYGSPVPAPPGDGGLPYPTQPAQMPMPYSDQPGQPGGPPTSPGPPSYPPSSVGSYSPYPPPDGNAPYPVTAPPSYGQATNA